MSVKLIRLSQHARDRLARRGATEQEIVETIRTAAWQSAELERIECRKVFPYHGLWNNRRYTRKEVRPIFVEGHMEIVVITVYVYYA